MLNPLKPGPLYVFCVQCGARVSSVEVLCDLDGKPCDYYCPACAAGKETRSESI